MMLLLEKSIVLEQNKSYWNVLMLVLVTISVEDFFLLFLILLSVVMVEHIQYSIHYINRVAS